MSLVDWELDLANNDVDLTCKTLENTNQIRK